VFAHAGHLASRMAEVTLGAGETAHIDLTSSPRRSRASSRTRAAARYAASRYRVSRRSGATSPTRTGTSISAPPRRPTTRSW
jgi:hypothetical protein